MQKNGTNRSLALMKSSKRMASLVRRKGKEHKRHKKGDKKHIKSGRAANFLCFLCLLCSVVRLCKACNGRVGGRREQHRAVTWRRTYIYSQPCGWPPFSSQLWRCCLRSHRRQNRPTMIPPSSLLCTLNMRQ